MHKLLGFMFVEGVLKDDFRLYPTPQKDGLETEYRDGTVIHGPWATRCERWAEQRLDRIPDWDKVSAYLDARDLIAKHEH